MPYLKYNSDRLDMPQENLNKQKKILVVGPAWVGDMVMAQSLFKTLKDQNPECIIDVLAPPWSLPLLKRMPEINEGIALPIEHGKLNIFLRYYIGKNLRAKKYDQAITLPRSLKAALVPFFAKIPIRTGYRGEMRYGFLNDIKKLDNSVLTQTVQRFTALGHNNELDVAPKIFTPQLKVDKANCEWFIKELNLKTSKPVIAFMPGAEYGEAKRWPTEYFRQLAEMLVSNGYHIWILGSEKEAELGAIISKGYEEDVINLCGKTKLKDVIDLLSFVGTAVSNDSGLMHIACAVGVKVIAIYGSSDPKYTPPLSDNAAVVYLNMSCSPCFQRTCQLEHLDCLRDIKPLDIFNRIY